MQKNEIIILHNQNVSNRQIAKKLGISRTTVNKYVNQAKELICEIEKETNKTTILQLQAALVGPPKKKSSSTKRVFNGDLKNRFDELLEIDQKRNQELGLNKQHLTAALIHRILISEGYKVGITTIQNEFKNVKNKTKECFIKQEYEPGQRAEYDFHEIKVILNGKVRKFYQATITLPNSDIIFTKYYDNQRMESFIDSLVSFFEFIGGVPNTIVFDNMRNVVRKFIFRNEKEYTVDLIKLSNYYKFEIITTNPRKGNEKGHVENSGKIARTNFFSLKYRFASVEEMRSYANDELSKLNAPKKEAFENEKLSFTQLPSVRYELGRIVKSHVSSSSFISIDNNFYSVPDQYVGKTVYSNVYLDYINVFNCNNEKIAYHNKKVGKGEYSVELLHFTSTLLKKPGALSNSLALKQAPKVYQVLFHKYFTTNVKEYLALIKELDIYEITEVLNALDAGKSYKGIKMSKSNSIEDISISQLNKISNLYNQDGRL